MLLDRLEAGHAPLKLAVLLDEVIVQEASRHLIRHQLNLLLQALLIWLFQDGL